MTQRTPNGLVQEHEITKSYEDAGRTAALSGQFAVSIQVVLKATQATRERNAFMRDYWGCRPAYLEEYEPLVGEWEREPLPDEQYEAIVTALCDANKEPLARVVTMAVESSTGILTVRAREPGTEPRPGIDWIDAKIPVNATSRSEAVEFVRNAPFAATLWANDHYLLDGPMLDDVVLASDVQVDLDAIFNSDLIYGAGGSTYLIYTPEGTRIDDLETARQELDICDYVVEWTFVA